MPQGEVDSLKSKVIRLEKENKELAETNQKLEQKVWSLTEQSRFRPSVSPYISIDVRILE